jgi:ferritin-like metal-binding protein YciE
MAVYGTIRNYAASLGRDDFADLLQRTLDEEGEADRKLTRIAESKINSQVARH